MPTAKKPTAKKAEKAEKTEKVVAEKAEKTTATAKKAAPRAKKAAAPAKAEEATPIAASAASDVESILTQVAAPAFEFDMSTMKHLKEGEYVYAVGRRKTAVAVTKLFTGGKGEITVNKKPYNTYFTTFATQSSVVSPLKAVGMDDAVSITIVAKGGGLAGQADAARHGIARALIILNPNYRLALKKLGFLTRDPRKKERKKFGLKGARRAPQWAKR